MRRMPDLQGVERANTIKAHSGNDQATQINFGQGRAADDTHSRLIYLSEAKLKSDSVVDADIGRAGVNQTVGFNEGRHG